MAVAEVSSSQLKIKLIAFSSNGTNNPNAVAVINLGERPQDLQMRVNGAGSRSFNAYLTGGQHRYRHTGAVAVRDGRIDLKIPGESVVTLFAEDSK